MSEIGKPPRRKIRQITLEPKSEQDKPSGRRTTIILAVTFLVVIAIVVVVSIYFFIWQDLWRTILTVNDETINMDYFIRRMKYVDNTDDILSMLYEKIPNEILIRQGVSRYGIEVTPDEIDEMLRDFARGDNETISESEFRVFYRNVLNETKLTDAEYRELVATSILSERLTEYLVENIPTVAEQIHLYIIVLPSYEEAGTAITRIQNGEEFSELASELSLDSVTGEQGGDAGWWPEGGGLVTSIEWIAFNLEVGQVSNPILIDEEGQIYAICMVTERQLTREIEEDKLTVLKNGVLQEWLDIERVNSTITFGGMDWSEREQRYVFGSKSSAWISLQLAKE